MSIRNTINVYILNIYGMLILSIIYIKYYNKNKKVNKITDPYTEEVYVLYNLQKIK